MNMHPTVDRILTPVIAAAGFAAQMVNLELIFKALIGGAALLFVLLRCFVYVLKNWDAFRHPVKFMREFRRNRKKHFLGSTDDETTTT